MDLRGAINRRITARIPVRTVRNRSAAPLASVTFDDFPRSAWHEAAPILRRHSVKATYYAVGGWVGQTVDRVEQYTVDDLKAVAAEGHEIASHTYSHKAVHSLASEAIRADEAANAAFFGEHVGEGQVTAFAYPYGEVSPRTKRLYGELYASSRGIREGVNGPTFDLAQLKAYGIERKSWSEAHIEAAVKEAVDRKAWVIFFTHDISNDPTPYGATPQMLEHAILTLKAAGVETLTVRDALARTQAA
jgi:peptidoglycan/xylan/chitin deacetylase (PgdA/CDA1 family)